MVFCRHANLHRERHVSVIVAVYYTEVCIASYGEVSSKAFQRSYVLSCTLWLFNERFIIVQVNTLCSILVYNVISECPVESALLLCLASTFIKGVL